MSGACGDLVKTIQTIFVAENSISSARKCFRANDAELRGYFTRATRCQSQLKKNMLKVNDLPLTRALLGGGGVWTPPSCFSRIAKIRRRCAPPGFHPPYPHLFRNFCKNFDPRPCEVRSPGQVVTHFKITFQSRHGYNVSGKLWNFRNM